MIRWLLHVFVFGCFFVFFGGAGSVVCFLGIVCFVFVF